ncbi:MAG: ABC transporter permease [Bauldia sp.]|uniref:ABC transporter permease n=1 Tax=Bauldia sp. TaxID=2575872 RepID=UPI001D1BD0A7|nr:ABC transporter permease [Bauldia sp.]MCB1495083.1 ABC transporter permease [Bauldia sp.]
MVSEVSAPPKSASLVGALVGNNQIVLVAALVVICVGISLAVPQFYSSANIIAILRQVAMVLIVACGMTMLLITAEVDLSVGASLAFVGVVAMDVINVTDSVFLGALAGIAFGALVGLVNGLIVTRLKVNSLIATIGTMMILQGGVFLYSREAIQNHHHLPSFVDIGAGYVGPVPIPVIVAAVIFIASYVVLRHTTLGRYLFAVGANEKTARLSGLRTTWLKLFAFVLTGALVGVAGLILGSLMNAGQPTAGRGFELTVIAAVILGGTSLSGGRGTLIGTLLGVFVLKVIDDGIIVLQWNQDLQMIVPGVVLIAAIYLDILRRRADAR